MDGVIIVKGHSLRYYIGHHPFSINDSRPSQADSGFNPTRFTREMIVNQSTAPRAVAVHRDDLPAGDSKNK
jgi:hypothetical protein